MNSAISRMAELVERQTKSQSVMRCFFAAALKVALCLVPLGLSAYHSLLIIVFWRYLVAYPFGLDTLQFLYVLSLYGICAINGVCVLFIAVLGLIPRFSTGPQWRPSLKLLWANAVIFTPMIYVWVQMAAGPFFDGMRPD